MSVKTRTQSRFARTRQAYQRAWRARDFHAAEKHAQALVATHPKQAYSWRALGASFIELGQPGKALESLREAARVAPNDAHTAYLTGTAHRALKQWEAAGDQLRRALTLDPGHALAHTEYARVHLATGNVDKALESIATARRLDPNNPFILTQSITAHSAARKMADVLEDCQRLLNLDDRSPQYFNLAAVKHCEMGLFDQAARYYEQALALDPDYLAAFSNRVFNAHYDPTLSDNDIATLIRRWHDRFSPTSRPARPDTGADERRPLTIGLLSAGLRSHPVGQMITSALEQLPADAFQLVAYSTSDTEDHITHRLRRLCARWHQMQGYSDDLLETQLREDRVDILIDLSGHTDGNRLRLIAREPAPLIVKWVGGLVNTTGLDAIDYLISDGVETPPGVDERYYEKLIRLPDDYICYSPPDYAPPVKDLPALSQGRLTFGCLNNPAKLNDELIREWATLLHEVPGSQLLLRSAQYSDPAFRDRVWERFQQAGIERDRILMEGPDKHAAFLDTYNRIDIALDPWPYSGGLTTCEALLMGVPVITLPGPTFAGRHAATHLVNAGLPELVVDSWDAYRARARELAGDLNSLAAIRRNLRDTLMRSPVCDAPRFAGHLTTALRGIWRRHCRQQPPAALTFDGDGTARFEDGDRIEPYQASGPALVHAADRADPAAGHFEFDFTGKVIALDNGGRLLETGAADSLLNLNAFELLVFDPLGQHAERRPAEQDGFQYFASAGLGDGRPATHYACLDPTQSATLKPLDDTKVLAEVPVQTVALGTIEGLPSLDWLLLDERNDSLAVLRHGGDLLAEALLIQARVRLRPGHQGQPGLAALIQAAEANGFRLYRLNNEDFHSHFPGAPAADRQASELAATDLIFLPEAARLDALDANRKRRLAFLLHTVYGIQDLAWSLLDGVDSDAARSYLAALAPAGATPADPPKSEVKLPDAPHMSDSERALFDRCLAPARHYFEFGAGGSTVRAREAGLTVQGVESDRQWVDALTERLGDHCQVRVVDIGPTREWGFPVDDRARARFPEYSEAIHHHDQAFDLILVDGRFRVACVLNAIRHTINTAADPGATRIFIHDFWDRPHYHAVLEFLDTEESAETAGVFRIKPDPDQARLAALLEQYRYQPA